MSDGPSPAIEPSSQEEATNEPRDNVGPFVAPAPESVENISPKDPHDPVAGDTAGLKQPKT